MVKVEEDSCGIDSVSKASKTPTVISFGKTLAEQSKDERNV
jgi:hypothetical protein